MNLPNSNIRKTKLDDLEKLKNLYSSAFPEENLIPLIQELHHDKINVFSFVFEEQSNIIGHISFSECHINEHPYKLALLGPMAVTPKKQKQGAGSLLIQHGLQFLADQKFDKVSVLGDPNYYGRFGFLQEKAILPPYPIPKEWDVAWQSIVLSENILNCSGSLIVPKPWQNSQLWSA